MGRVTLTALLLAALVGCAMAYPLAGGQATRADHMETLFAAKRDPRPLFTAWVQKFEKAYHSNLVEFERRFLVWLSNLEYVLEYNSKTTTHWLGLNAMADWTQDEYRSRLGYRPELKKLGASKASPFSYADVVANATVDWRTKGVVTPVKNQEQCGSCWAFSTTGSVEGINAMVTGELVSLSEQELVDCDTSMDHGCRGGLMDYAFEFIMENGGLDTEDDYKYIAEDAKCDLDKENHHVVTIDGYEDVPAYDEESLKKAVSQQPVSVAIEADQRAFQLYAGGVFDAACGTELDHGVLVVGYGSDVTEAGEPIDYWIVKNSWGAEWGDEGYIRMVRGISDSAGQCGIAMAASYPTKTGPNPSPGPPPSPTPVPPGPPPAVQCDSSNTECPSGATCCCAREFFGYCFTWACCPLEEATCCDDHEHCCPSDLPVCDTVAGRCLAKVGSIEGSVEWSAKFPATKPSGRSIFHLPWSQEQRLQQQGKQVKGRVAPLEDAAAAMA